MFVRRRHRPRATLAGASAPVHGPPGPVQPAARTSAPKLISWTALALLTVGSVGNLGSASALAVVGLASVFLYVLPALVFLVPVSLVAAELASGWQGGVYNWVSQGISAPMGLLAVWCEFAQTIFFYPALLAYVADTLAYPFDPGLASNGVYTAVVIIVLFWGGVLLCSFGPTLVARLGSRGTGIGTLIPAAILLGLGVAYLVQGHHPVAPMTARHLLPAWNGLASIVLVVNSFFTYAGVEVNAVHVNELKNPAREYPKSIFLAMALVLAVFIGPTLAISWVIPSAKISFTVGVMQAFSSLFNHFGLGFAVPVIAIALAVGALAGMISWLDGPSEGLLLIGRRHGVPPALLPEGQPLRHRGAHHRHGGRRDHPHRRAVRVHPERLARLLDLHRAGHAGVPDHVRADVHRRDQAAPFATGSLARLPSPGAGPAVPARHRLVRRRARDRVHPAVAVQPLEPAQVHPGDTGRDPRSSASSRRC